MTLMKRVVTKGDLPQVDLAMPLNEYRTYVLLLKW